MSSTFIASLRQGLSIFVVLVLGFFLLEPAISLGASATAGFTVSETISIELAVVTPPVNVTMAPSLGGITGGVSNGSTQFVVKTNDHAGYQVSMTSSSTLGMIGAASSTNYIPWYVPAIATTPDYTFSSTTGKAVYGFTVEASTSNDVAPMFYENGTTCGGSATNHTNTPACWIGATSTALTIVNRIVPTPAGGATTTMKFRVAIIGTPNPILPDDTYVSTTTLTMTSN